MAISSFERASKTESLLVSQVLECHSCGGYVNRDDAYCQECGHSLVKRPLSTEAVRANTERFFSTLLPSMEQLMDPELQDNAIRQQSILIVGASSSGKTAKTKTIARRVVEKYGAKNVAVQVIDGRDLATLLSQAWPRKLIQLIQCEDVTDVQFKDEVLQGLWKIRQTMEKQTGLQRGLVLLVYTVHSYFEAEKAMRLRTDFTLFSDVPTSPIHRRMTHSYFIPDKEDQERLRQIARQRMSNPKLCGYAYMIDHGEPAGFVYLPQVKTEGAKGRLLLGKIAGIFGSRIKRPNVSPSGARGFPWGFLVLIGLGLAGLWLLSLFR